MSITSQSKDCPKCGGPIPAEAPQGLCPRCLLMQASIPTEAGRGAASKSAPPTQEELAAAFPQLEILELIGQGGMGFVFKARQPKLDRFVALKILPASLAADSAFAERFTREGRMLARLTHPNIVAIHDFGQANGFFYLLMEFVDGVNLRQAMKVGRFTPAQALAVVPKICEALQFAHNEGVLHRDIKPENILLDSKGRVKIADFGIAKLVGADGPPFGVPASAGPGRLKAELQAAPVTLTETGKVLGTPQYMAPEQLEHPQDVDPRADIYSLGVVFYEMLTGELPIGRFALPSERSAADPRVDQVVLRALEKQRERRTQSAGEVKTQVEAIAGSSAPTDPEMVWVQPEPSSGIRSRRIRLALAAGLGLALVFVLGLTWLIPYLLKQSGSAGPDSDASLLSASEPFTKTIVLTRATNQLVGHSGDVRTVTIWSDATVYPGEILQAKQRLVDGEMASASTSLHVRRAPHKTTTSSGFTWFFRDAFGEEEAQAAVAQLQQNMSGRPLVLTVGKPLALFSVTNKSGGVLSAYLEFKHVPPDPPISPAKSVPKAHATVRLRPSGTLIFYSAKVPPGYALQATANWSAVDDGEAYTMSPSGPYGYNSSWSLPSFRFTYEHQQALATQVQRLAEQGPIEVVFGEPRLLFSVTNKSHEVFQGLLELVGPPAATGHSMRISMASSQPAALARSTATPPASPDAKSHLLSLVAKSARGQPSTKKLFTKTVALTGATNELLNATNNLRVVRVRTDSTLVPGETLVALSTLPDGRTVEDGSTSFFVHRLADRVQTSSYFSWTLPDPFNPDDYEAAATQLRQNQTGRPIKLVAGKPLELFSVTNESGGVVRGFIRYERFVPEAASVSAETGANVQATVRLRPYGGGLLAFYTASVPPGYFLEATDNSSELGGFGAHTSNSGPAGNSSSWSPPPSFAYERQREAVAQLQRLAEKGPIRVTYGKPFQLFSITNTAGEVYKGYFELVGPPASANQ